MIAVYLRSDPALKQQKKGNSFLFEFQQFSLKLLIIHDIISLVDKFLPSALPS